MKHVLWITAAIVFVGLCTLLPFLPGSYDRFAMTLFMMAQGFGIASLLWVPVGIGWLVYRLVRSDSASNATNWNYAFAVLAIIMAVIVAGLLALMAFLSGLSLGIVAFGLCALLVWKAVRRLRHVRAMTFSTAHPMYLIAVPIGVVVLQWLIAEPATEFSRSRAIANSAPLIADLERYHATHGTYPPSLLALHPDYKPSVIGISQYHYEPSGESYNVFFEQPSFRLGTQEIVMYNPRGEQMMIGHAMDRLMPRPLLNGGGFYAVHEAAQPRWKYFWFD